MLRKISAAVSGKSLEDHVAAAQASEPNSDAHRKALWGIREAAEKSRNNDQIVRSGALKVMVATLADGTSEEKLWALYVLRMLADDEVGASFVLQEPNAIESLVSALATSVMGSEHAKRSIETFKGLAVHLSTQVLLAREDVYKVMVAAMNAQPPEAKAALAVYALLSEVESGSFPPCACFAFRAAARLTPTRAHINADAKSMDTEKARSTLGMIQGNSDFSKEDRELAKRVLDHISGAGRA